MNYERLTNNLASTCYCNSIDCKIPCHECYYKKVFDRLAELEDKIKKGTLIELPCKVGEIVYGVVSKCSIIDNCEFRNSERENCLRGICEEHIKEVPFDLVFQNYMGKTIFTSKEEAEAKLKELKEREE